MDINKILEFATHEQIKIALFIFIAITLTVGIYLFFKLLLSDNSFDKFIKTQVSQMQKSQTLRHITYNENEYQYKEFEKGILYKLDKTFQYSKIQNKFPFLSSGLLIVSTITFSIISAGIVITATGNIVLTVAAAIAILFGVYAVVALVARMNYIAVEKDLLDFLNQLKAYNSTSDDILTCFRAISENVHNPLRDSLLEFYLKVQVNGKKSQAFFELMNSIEHPLFKQFIRNLEICSRNSADYDIIADNCKKTLKNYLNFKKELRAQSKSDAIIMAVLVIAFFVSAFALGTFIDENVFMQLFTTVVGNFLILLQLALVIAFIWNGFVKEEG